MVDFSAFKNRSKGSLDRLNKEVEKMKTGSTSFVDERIWKPTVDPSGNASATIRFLPEAAVDGEDALPWVRVWSHGFQGPGGSWYIENSLTTVGKQDPVSEYNSKLWNTGLESDKDIARDQKRRLSHYSNILVVDDPANPENNGKVFLFRYGVKIFDKITEKTHPEFEEDVSFDPFDPWTGADFKLRQRKYQGYPNFDKSFFTDQKAISIGEETLSDERIEEIWKSQYSLNEFIDADGENYKPYDELLAKLNRVVGFDTQGGGKAPTAAPVSESDNVESLPPRKTAETSDDEDDSLEYFQQLANAD